MHCEAFEQTLRLRLVSGPVDKKKIFSVGIACPLLTRAGSGSLLRSVGPPGRAESYGVIKITDTSRTFYI